MTAFTSPSSIRQKKRCCEWTSALAAVHEAVYTAWPEQHNQYSWDWHCFFNICFVRGSGGCVTLHVLRNIMKIVVIVHHWLTSLSSRPNLIKSISSLTFGRLPSLLWRIVLPLGRQGDCVFARPAIGRLKIFYKCLENVICREVIDE